MSASRGENRADLVPEAPVSERRLGRVQRTGDQDRRHQAGHLRIVAVDGNLATASAEWLCSDGLGAYASSTIALMHTRRQHGLLVASPSPLEELHVFLSHLDITLRLGEQSISLATHQFPSVEPTRGYEHLTSFAQDPLPRWVFSGPGWELERTLALVRDASVVVLRHEWRGADPVVIEARPLLAMRPASRLMHQHGGFQHRVCLRADTVTVHPVRALPRVVFRCNGRFVGSPDWWHRFEYLGEHGPGVVHEDLWTPGVYRVELQPGDAAWLVCAVGSAPQAAAEDLLRDAFACRGLCRPGLVGNGSYTLGGPGLEKKIEVLARYGVGAYGATTA